MSVEYQYLQPKLTSEHASETMEGTTQKKEHKRPHSEKRRKNQDSLNYSIEEYVEVLLKEQKQWQSKSKYREASMCKQHIEGLKQQLQRRNLRIIQTKHRKEKKQIRKAHQYELQQMDKVWAKIVNSYEFKANSLLDKWRHKREMQLRDLDGAAQAKQREHKTFSKQLIMLKETQRKLAALEDYQNAEKVHKQIVLKQQKVHSQSDIRFKQTMQRLTEKVNKQHKKEYNALMKRIMSGKQEQEIMYKNQRKKIRLKYENVLKQLQKQQQSELQNIAKYNKNQNVMNLSRLNASWIINNSQI